VNRPDLRWIQDQLSMNGLTFDPIRGDGFNCQCPVHQGDGKSARFALRNGVLLFTCYAYGCDFRDMKDALDLTDGDVYEERIIRDRQRAINKPMATDAHAYIVVAENDMRHRRLNDRELAKYRAALIQAHKGAA